MRVMHEGNIKPDHLSHFQIHHVVHLGTACHWVPTVLFNTMCTASVTELRDVYTLPSDDDAFGRLVSSLTFLLWDYIVTLPDEV